MNMENELFQAIQDCAKSNRLVLKRAVNKMGEEVCLLCSDNGAAYYPLAELINPGDLKKIKFL